MNHKESIKTFIGNRIIETTAYGVQCVAYAKEYTKARGRAIGPFGGSAIKGWENKSKRTFGKRWVRVLNTPLAYPPEGALIFWSEKRCKHGHVAVANGLCNPILLRYSDQNGGGKSEAITHRWGSYTNVLGWYVYKD